MDYATPRSSAISLLELKFLFSSFVKLDEFQNYILRILYNTNFNFRTLPYTENDPRNKIINEPESCTLNPQHHNSQGARQTHGTME